MATSSVVSASLGNTTSCIPDRHRHAAGRSTARVGPAVLGFHGAELAGTDDDPSTIPPPDDRTTGDDRPWGRAPEASIGSGSSCGDRRPRAHVRASASARRNVVHRASRLGPRDSSGPTEPARQRRCVGLTALDSGAAWEGRPVDARVSGTSPRSVGCTRRCGSSTTGYLGHSAGLDKATRRDVARTSRPRRSSRRSNLEDLSLGNQQRIQLIGRARVDEPDALILDEPFSGLDPIAVDALLQGPRVRGGAARRAVLLSSHQLDLVEHFARTPIVDRGRAVVQGPLDELAQGHDPVLLIDVPGDPDVCLGRGSSTPTNSRCSATRRAPFGSAWGESGGGRAPSRPSMLLGPPGQ